MVDFPFSPNRSLSTSHWTLTRSICMNVVLAQFITAGFGDKYFCHRVPTGPTMNHRLFSFSFKAVYLLGFNYPKIVNLFLYPCYLVRSVSSRALTCSLKKHLFVILLTHIRYINPILRQSSAIYRDNLQHMLYM